MKTRLPALLIAILLLTQTAALADSWLLDPPWASLYDTDETYPDFTTKTGLDLAKKMKAADIYAMYDGLVEAWPGYAKRELLGYEASEEGLPVYLYTFAPPLPPSAHATLFPAVFLTCGVHGEEKAPPVIAYLLMKHLCGQWQENALLETLRYNAKYLIIPVANPYGWNHNQRRNAGGVDLNRNFPDGWTLGDPERSTYGGPEPLSEPESRFIRTVFERNPDIAAAFDFHNFFSSPERREFLYVNSTNEFTSHVFRYLIASLTRKWRGEFAFFPGDEAYFAGRVAGGSAGMVAGYAYNTFRVRHSGTLEVCQRFLVDDTAENYNNDMCKGGVETLANFLLLSLRYLDRMPSR